MKWWRIASSVRPALWPAPALGRFLIATSVLIAIQSNARAGSDDPPIRYSTTPALDPVAALKEKLDRGQLSLQFDEKNGYLASLLQSLKISPSTQGLVFSKTSFQRELISPHHPRALYFNDDTYVGCVHDGRVLEIASMDPRQGAIFYTLEQKEALKPKIIRQTSDCLQCHEGGMTQGVPGLLMRSVYPEDDGMPAFAAGTFVTTDQSPFAQRWGGWYVTGTHGRMRHMGNVTIDDDEHPEVLDTKFGANTTKLSGRIKVDQYLRPDSDIVAVMVLAHQTALHNLLTKASYEVRTALRDQAAMNEALKEKPTYRSEGTRHRIQYACEPVVKALLFSGEAVLPDPVKGTSGFTQEFPAAGPRDSRGRSLRDFDLAHHLFKYRCSYLIYSRQFDALPDEARQYIYQRLWDVLSEKDKTEPFAHLTHEQRKEIMQILLETKHGLPDYWRGQ
jgi:hypothetical protein